MVLWEDIDLSQAIRLGVIFVCLFEVYVNKIQIAELEHDAVRAAARDCHSQLTLTRDASKG